MSLTEIERKFLVVNDDWRSAVVESFSIQQFYFPAIQENLVKFQIVNDKGSISIEVIPPGEEQGFSLQVLHDVISDYGVGNLHHFTDGKNNAGFIQIGDSIEARIRSKNGRFLFTVKADTEGADTRYEFEFPVSPAHGQKLIGYCQNGIEKMRHVVPRGDLKWEIDEFSGKHTGLILAEIELPASNHTFERPVWLGEDVTKDKRFKNKSLATKPYPFLA